MLLFEYKAEEEKLALRIPHHESRATPETARKPARQAGCQKVVEVSFSAPPAEESAEDELAGQRLNRRKLCSTLRRG